MDLYNLFKTLESSFLEEGEELPDPWDVEDIPREEDCLRLTDTEDQAQGGKKLWKSKQKF